MKTRSGSRRAWTRRALSLLLAAVMVLGFFPGFPGAENSGAQAHWADPYLSQLVEWGVIREDQANNPNLALTRADFMAIVNRAYGYKTPGETPFEDVEPNKWYYDDVGIAYTARYIVGTSPTTASPNNPLTRETATTILGRNMMLQESPGEILDFTDARQIANWAMGTVKSSLEHYIVNGYNDGTFRPKRNVSWGEMAAMVTKLVGTPLQEPGDYSLGGVFGNVTITSSDVTLRDSVVGGDVYITSGVGLGNVKLENVNVLGRIIASGTGRSEGGEASILLRNVTADELLIDNMQDDYVSVQVDGISEIPNTTVRTSAYIEDNTPDGMGLQHISIEGDTYPEGEEPEDWEPIQVDLAGRIGEVVNRTPGSQVRVAKGTVEKLTVDESATDSTVIIDRGAVVKELALDTSTYVTGEGDIGHLIVNAPGCVIDILPDQITIRPGITAIIAGEEMDSVAAEEFSMDPLILAGYPEAHDITPTGLEAIFMTNKAGTIYYAVSPITDGSVGEEDLIDPPSYGNIAVVNGSVKVSKGNEEVVAAIGGLTPGGSYYLSAVLVDAKGNRSPVKVISFTTPDNTIPAFCEGYPYMSKVSPKDSVVVTMTNKDCKLYYALLPEGAVAPTEMEMKTNAVAGALGYGVRDAKKNVEDVFRVNDQILKEQTTYVLYFFLCDADGVNKSPITSITFTTADETKPFFIVEPTVTKVDKSSVTMTFTLNEDGTVYWVAIPSNTTNYPKPEPGTSYEIAPPDSMYGMLQIENGMNIGTDGKSGKVACKGNTPGTITVSGLKPETTYDFYYMAKDTAGNYTEVWKKITISPLDESGPKFSQSFSDSSSLDGKSDPHSSTAIYLDVTEDIRYTGEGGGTSFLTLYQAVKDAKNETERNAAKNKLAASLYGAIKLHQIDVYDSSEEEVKSKWQTGQTLTDWVIDYTEATVTANEGGIRITFPKNALHLENGGQYYFTIEKVTDISTNQNPVVPSRVDFYTNESLSKSGGHDVPVFIVEFARVDFSTPGLDNMPIRRDKADVDPYHRPTGAGAPEGGYAEDDYVRRDMSFRMKPVSTETVANNIRYDLLLWTDSVVQFDLYYRVVDANGNRIDTEGVYPESYTIPNGDQTLSANQTVSKNDYLLTHLGPNNSGKQADVNGWFYLGNSGPMNPTNNSWSGRGVNYYFNGCKSLSFPQLRNLNSNLRYEVVIHLTRMGTIDEYDEDGQATWKNWNGEVKFFANVAAGQGDNLENLCGSLTQANWEAAKKLGLGRGAVSIGRNSTKTEPIDTQELSRLFTDSRLPRFEGDEPRFTPAPTAVDVDLRFTSPGTLYYVVGKADLGGTDRLPEITTTRKLLTGLKDAAGNPVVYPEGTATAAGTGNDLKLFQGSTDTVYIRLQDIAEDGKTILAPPKSGAGLPNTKWMIGGIKDTPPATVDDPEKENLIVRPLNQYIFDPSGQSDTANAVHGNFPFRGNTNETMTIEGLLPETDYFAYFVIKGEADTLSHVYIYHFRTPKATKPSIDINQYTDSKDDSKGGASFKTSLDAKLQYRVFSLKDAQEKTRLLTKTITIPNVCYNNFPNKTDLTPKMTTDADGNQVQAKDEDGNPLWEMTIIKALSTKFISSYDSQHSDMNNFSMFDVYADQDLKISMRGFLRGEYQPDLMDPSLNPADTGELDTTTKWKDELMNITKGTDYVVLAMARTPESDENDWTVYSFAGMMPLRLGKQTGPEVLDWYANIIVGNGTATEFTGDVEIYFDKPLYTSDGSTKLTTENVVDSGILPSTWKDGMGKRIKVLVKSDDYTTTLTFTGTWLRTGDHISIAPSFIRGPGGVAATKMLSMDIKPMTNPAGMQATLKWGSEDKTTYKFPYEVTATPLSGQFNTVATSDLTFDGSYPNYSLLIPERHGPVDIFATIMPELKADDFYYRWTVPTGPVTIEKTDSGNKDNGNHAYATLTTKSAGGPVTVQLEVKGTDTKGNPVDGTLSFLVTVAGLTFGTATGEPVDGTPQNDTIVWDLGKNGSVQVTLNCTAPLTNIDVSTAKISGSTALQLSNPKPNGQNITFNLSLTGGTATPSAGTKETIKVDIDGLTCSFIVDYKEGTNQSGMNIAGVKPF